MVVLLLRRETKNSILCLLVDFKVETPGRQLNYESGPHGRHQDRKHHLTGVCTIKELARSLKANV